MGGGDINKILKGGGGKKTIKLSKVSLSLRFQILLLLNN